MLVRHAALPGLLHVERAVVARYAGQLRGLGLCSRRFHSVDVKNVALEESIEDVQAGPEQLHPLGAGPVFQRGEFVTVRDQKDRHA